MQPAEEKKEPVLPEERPRAQASDSSLPQPSTSEREADNGAVSGTGGESRAKPAKSSLRESLETVLIALLLALLIRSFLVQQYVVEGESMYPTLHDGDRLLVNKLVYRLGEPEPGDIIVLEDPANPRRQLIKRVIAVGGETVEVKNHVVFVDGKPLEEQFTNPSSVHFADVRPMLVPEGYVYVMGDNRGASMDSRALGPIQIRKVEGKASLLFWPFSRFEKESALQLPRTYMQ